MYYQRNRNLIFVFLMCLNASYTKLTISPLILDKLEEYGISSFGVSVTTLEEVFMKVGEGSEKPLHDL